MGRRAWLTPSKVLVGLSLLFLAGIALRHAQGFRATVMDDAYITYRHAENLASGAGPVYNPGERVEGSSSFLLVVILAAAIRLGADVTTAAPRLGMLCFAALVPLTHVAVRRVVTERVGVLLGLGAAAVVAASTPLAYYAASGMETAPYALLLMGAVCLELRPVRAGPERRERAWAAPVLWGLAATARPEGAALFTLALAIDALPGLIRADAADRVLRKLGWFALVYGPVLVFRRLYYGTWVPMPVIAKAGALDAVLVLPFPAAVAGVLRSAGAVMVGDFAARAGAGALFAVAALLGPATRRAAVTSWVPCLGCAAVVVWNEGDWFPHFRLLSPAIPPLAVLVAFGVRALLFQAGQRWRGGHAPSALFAAGLFALTADRLHYERNYKFPHAETADYMQWLGKALAENRRPDDLLATDMAGIIPYWSKMRTIDTFGLCNAYIARHGKRQPAMGRTHWPYVYGHRPTFYQLNALMGFAQMYRDPHFARYAQDYWAVVTPAYRDSRARDRKLLLVRRDRPDVEALARALGAELVEPREEFKRLQTKR